MEDWKRKRVQKRHVPEIWIREIIVWVHMECKSRHPKRAQLCKWLFFFGRITCSHTSHHLCPSDRVSFEDLTETSLSCLVEHEEVEEQVVVWAGLVNTGKHSKHIEILHLPAEMTSLQLLKVAKLNTNMVSDMKIISSSTLETNIFRMKIFGSNWHLHNHQVHQIAQFAAPTIVLQLQQVSCHNPAVEPIELQQEDPGDCS